MYLAKTIVSKDSVTFFIIKKPITKDNFLISNILGRYLN